MSKNMDPDKINFNYPIPRSLHYKIRELGLRSGMSVKDIVINSLVMYVKEMNKILDDEMIERAAMEAHGTDPFDEDDL